jgi:hypothetical protein
MIEISCALHLLEDINKGLVNIFISIIVVDLGSILIIK